MNDKNFEMRIYELFGVKFFKNIVLFLAKVVVFLFAIFLSKEKQQELYSMPSNYKMKKGNGLQDLRDFKRKLLLNGLVHIFALLLCIPNFLKIFCGWTSFMEIMDILIPIIINFYCIMLQRYNYIRINRVLKKGEIREKKQKNVILKQLKQETELFNDLEYKIVNKKEEEVIITFDDFLKMATLKQLKEYKEKIKFISKQYNCLSQIDKLTKVDIDIPLEKGKTLKLKNKHCKGYSENGFC